MELKVHDRVTYQDPQHPLITGIGKIVALTAGDTIYLEDANREYARRESRYVAVKKQDLKPYREVK